MKALPWILLAVVLAACLGTGGWFLVTKNKPEAGHVARDKSRTYGDFIKLYPVPAVKQSAWMLDKLDKDEATYGTKTDDSSKRILENSRIHRQLIASTLKRMTEFESVYARSIADRLAYYRLSEMSKGSENMLRIIGSFAVLFEREILDKSILDFADDVGGTDKLASQHPELQSVIDDAVKRKK